MFKMNHPQNGTLKGWTICVGVIVFALLLTACGGSTGSKTYTIGVINLSSNQENTVKGFKEGMAELGYVEGKNVIYVYNGPVRANKLDEEAQGLVKAKVNLILSITTPATRAALKATTGTAIAVIFIPVTDPVGAGVVGSLTKPGGNTTGVSPVAQDGKRLEWLLRVAPAIKHVYIVYNPKDPSPVLALKTVSEAAAQLGVELITREAKSIEEAEVAFKKIPKEAEAIFLLPDSVVDARAANIYKIAAKRKLPTSGPNIEAVNDGALTAYGADLTIAARKQAARLANQILHGVKPADLPVETTELLWAINLKTAQAIGLDISKDILRQANVIIR